MSQVVRIFVNQSNFGEVVLINLSDDMAVSCETVNKVTACFNEHKDLVGYNLKGPISSLKPGYNKPTHSLMKIVNDELIEAGFEAIDCDFKPHLLVGYVETCIEHPDSDHLHICSVNVGKHVKTIVCGAANVEAGIKVVAALDNAVLPDGKLIKPSSLRGVHSDGMLCSKRELRLIDHPEKGILILDDSYEIGSEF